MHLSFGRILGYVVAALVTVAIGVAVLSRIPPVWRIVKAGSSD
jgi:hypothetical protein